GEPKRSSRLGRRRRAGFASRRTRASNRALIERFLPFDCPREHERTPAPTAMQTLSRLSGAVRAAFLRAIGARRRRSMDDRLAEELRFHIAMSAEQDRREGWSEVEAERRAHVRFGGRSRWSEEARDEYRSRLFDDFTQDVRYAVRTLRSTPS